MSCNEENTVFSYEKQIYYNGLREYQSERTIVGDPGQAGGW
jgi:hypothetical protein